MRHLLGAMLENGGAVTIVDTEAGLEHLSRGTARHVDTLLVTLEPYFKALETARRATELAREIGIARILGVANKIADETDRDAVRRFAGTHGISIAGEVPMDDELRRGDLAGRAPIDRPDSPAVKAIDALASALV